MGTIEVYDRADEFRIVIMGEFSGACVDEVARVCSAILGEATRRLLAIDITHLGGYDAAGRKLLQELYHHGTTIAAGTPKSLGFLYEISIGLVAGMDMLRDAGASHSNSKNQVCELQQAGVAGR